MSRSLVVVAFLSMCVLAFAGCAQKTDLPAPSVPASGDPRLVAADGRDLRTALKETDVIEAPQWKLGDWFGHHVLLNGGPEAGLHFNTIVVEDKADHWTLATDDKLMAKIDSVVDIPLIGATAKKDLSSTGFGAPWEPYIFPLKQGATWTREVSINGDVQKTSVKYDVTYNPAIVTPDGPRPGFDIQGTTAKGVLYAYDFVPDIQWYAHFFQFDLSTDAPDDFDFHVMSMGHGSLWTGSYFIDAAAPVIATVAGHGVDPSAPSDPWVQPEPYKTFNVPSGTTYLYGYAGAGAFAGASELVLIAPNNERYEFQAVDSGSGIENSKEMDLPPTVGEWKVVKEGAGAVIWNYVFLWAITETMKTL